MPTKSKESFWKGPYKTGITFSLLTKFLACRERFRLQVVEGLREKEEFNKALEFGNYWHEAEEAHSSGERTWDAAMEIHRASLSSRYPKNLEEVVRWWRIAKGMFPIYLKYYQNSPHSKVKPVLQEEVFAAPYKLPSGRTVTLRGKFDSVYIKPNGKAGIKDHKTKGEIDELGISRTLFYNLQTMLYAIAANTLYKEKHGSIREIVYNVIRRPLSDRFCPKKKKDESEAAFCQRVVEDVKEKPHYYFKRWYVQMGSKELKTFEMRTFQPILENLWDWWRSIRDNPFDPWFTGENKIPNKHHYQTPWGCYNSMFGGFRGDYFDLLTTGRNNNLVEAVTLFPEL